MPRRMQNFQTLRTPVQQVTLFQELVNVGYSRCRNSQPLRLQSQILIEGQVTLVHQYRGAGGLLEFLNAPHVIDMSVRGYDVFRPQAMFGQNLLDPLNVIPRIDHHCFTRGLIPEDRTITSQHSYWKDFMNHGGSPTF